MGDGDVTFLTTLQGDDLPHPTCLCNENQFIPDENVIAVAILAPELCVPVIPGLPMKGACGCVAGGQRPGIHLAITAPAQMGG